MCTDYQTDNNNCAQDTQHVQFITKETCIDDTHKSHTMCNLYIEEPGVHEFSRLLDSSQGEPIFWVK